MIHRIILLIALAAPLHAQGWWNPGWTQRQEVAIDASTDTKLPDATGPATVLLRLHDGNFQFANAAEGGADLRFVSADGTTVYPHHVERYDSLINEAFVWVNFPGIAPDERTTFNLYYGNAAPDAANAAAAAYDESTAAVYHFSERSGIPTDSTANANNATDAASATDGSLIGGGLRLLGGDPVAIPGSPSLAWADGGPATLSLWVNPSALAEGAVLLARGEGEQSFRLILDQGVPIMDVNGARSSAGAPVSAGFWHHLAVVADGESIRLHLNGEQYSLLQSALPELDGPIFIGGLDPAATDPGVRFNGEIDEVRFDNTARSAGWITLAAVGQGTSEAAQRLLVLDSPETGEGKAKGHNEALEHMMLFGDIARNMMFDGWIAVGVCVIMIIVGWIVAIQKFNYLNSVEKGTRAFLQQWKRLSSDLTAIDHSDESSVRSFGGSVDDGIQNLIKQSPLYRIYHIGSDEIRHRLARDKERTQGLSGRSIQAIRAALDGGLVHETHRLTKGLVYLTISIAGGPYVGLLGTVVGVMITFAIISKSGEVDVNSIAPGIASALLATVAGLVVAIPALFMYSYLNSRIKETTSGMQVFIDEFVAKMAEFYPPAGENSPHAAPVQVKETTNV